MMSTGTVTATIMPITAQKPQIVPANGTPTFMPQMDAIMVGMVRIMVIAAKNFITVFWLLLITLANASIVPDMISR